MKRYKNSGFDIMGVEEEGGIITNYYSIDRFFYKKKTYYRYQNILNMWEEIDLALVFSKLFWIRMIRLPQCLCYAYY